MARTTYTQHYSDFLGLDASSDPRAVARNRLAYAVNMWRDYESEQGAAVETFPGFRRAAHSLGLDASGGEIGAIHGLYHFRSRRGIDYVVVHAGTRIYALEDEALAAGDYEETSSRSAIISEGVADNDSTGFIYNNKLYILDGSHYLTVTAVDGETSELMASAVDAYVPTTYYNGSLYEQRNMLTVKALQVETGVGEAVEGRTIKEVIGIYEGTVIDTLSGWQENVEASALTYIGGAGYGDGSLSIGDFKDSKALKHVYVYDNYAAGALSRISSVELAENCFEGCDNLKDIFISVRWQNTSQSISFLKDCFLGCVGLKHIYLLPSWEDYQDQLEGIENIPEGAELVFLAANDPIWQNGLDGIYSDAEARPHTVSFPIYEMATAVTDATVDDEDKPLSYVVEYRDVEMGGETVKAASSVCFRPEDVRNEDGTPRRITLELELYPTHFGRVERLKSFVDGNTDYEGTTLDAINGCTKSAIYDGRVFLTGNPELPNTVFYSHRSLTGANDPAYFGIYNYFNDGEGNTPNVDILSTPSMLMVLKSSTVQDGSVYYHVGMDNTDEDTMNILPRVYPSTQGAAGLGSAGDATPSRLSCSFYDDPVFLSRRGLEAVGKETVNLERTIQHRSSNVDRLLVREELARASLAEWKRYLVICCNGHIYLADSRYMLQHTDGSYQYEWYYLEGVGTYEGYEPRWLYLTGYYPFIESDDVEVCSLDDYLVGGVRVGDRYFLREDGERLASDAEIISVTAYHPDNSAITLELYYVEEEGVRYIVAADGEEKRGVGRFFGATKLLTVGERLLFGTDNGDICIINTDRRGMPVGDRVVEYDRIDRSYYSFNGVPYLSGCSIKLDDCDKKSASKTTVSGTTSARFKMMPGSHCTAMVSQNGRDWEKLGEAFSSRLDFADVDFSSFSFAENEDNVVIFPEISRGWVNKQYYFYSDRFEAPFGLYELSYIYYVSGKIRY